MSRRPLTRRLLALVIAFALALDIATLALAGYAHVARTHVQVELVAEHVAIQIFVDCRLAYYFRSTGPAHVTYDLRWLDRSDILTFQVRGLKSPGYFRLSFLHDSNRVSAAARGESGHPVLIGPARVAVAESWTVDGRNIGEEGCQVDAAQQLPFAASTGGAWRRGTWLLGAADALAGVIPWVLAAIGALAVAGGALADRLHERSTRVGIAARALFASASLAVAVVLAVATVDFTVAFALCAAVGGVSLLVALVWLLREDVRRWAAVGLP
ncbi:MAG TPA: hypothetical protein VK707_10115 [Solirubrobacteraceae bacterium]|nr:hypothetical protein [Solirubrobacteraceae bacterium]